MLHKAFLAFNKVALLGLRGTGVFSYSRNYFGIVLFLERCYYFMIVIN